MVGYIGAIMIVFSTVFAFFSGRIDDILSSLLSGGSEAINFCLKTCGSICFFSGIMNVAQKSGLTDLFSKIFKPIIKFLFPTAFGESEIENAICMNIASNVFGLGNAATPMGIKAVELMRKKKDLNSPDRSISTFVVLNTVSVTLIPTTVASMLAAAGSDYPFSITPYILITQTVSCLVGLLSVFLLCSGKKKGRG